MLNLVIITLHFILYLLHFFKFKFEFFLNTVIIYIIVAIIKL